MNHTGLKDKLYTLFSALCRFCECFGCGVGWHHAWVWYTPGVDMDDHINSVCFSSVCFWEVYPNNDKLRTTAYYGLIFLHLSYKVSLQGACSNIEFMIAFGLTKGYTNSSELIKNRKPSSRPALKNGNSVDCAEALYSSNIIFVMSKFVIKYTG